MVSENITDVRKFMSALLIGNTFDSFLATDITITTYNTFHIDGHIKKAFYSSEEYKSIGSPEVSSWETLKPICFSLIKGHKTPLSFKMIFCLSKDATSQFITDNDIELSADSINGLFINIKFEENVLSYVTGTSLNIFTLDKSLEQSFDSYISKLISTLF